MKISTRISEDYIFHFDEARGFAMHKKKILKNKNSKCLSYIQSSAIIFIILLFISLITALIDGCLLYSYSLFFLSIIYVIFICLRIISSYRYREKNSPNNIIEIDEKGVTDESFYNIKITIKWSKIEAIVIGKYTVTILTDTPIYFYFDISKKKEILNEALNYIDNTKIIK